MSGMADDVPDTGEGARAKGPSVARLWRTRGNTSISRARGKPARCSPARRRIESPRETAYAFKGRLVDG